jgi:lipopolysaccharide transport system permease protein
VGKVKGAHMQDNLPVTIVKQTQGYSLGDLRQLWERRELLYFFVWRDIKVRYKQTVIGIAWVVLQPLAAMLIFTLFFGRLAKLPSDGIPYPVFTYTALVPWLFFANGISKCSDSLVNSVELVKKVYFPRLIIPISAVLSGLVDFVITFVVLMFMLPFFEIVPGPELVLVPLFILLACITCLGAGLWFSALNGLYRDVRYIVPFLIQLLFFASPVVYSSSLLAEPWRSLYGINPMAGIIEGFRWALLGSKLNIPGFIIGASASISMVLLISGLIFFTRVEKKIADVL